MINFKLKDISKWGSENSQVLIPPLQRGLVWKPNQVEMLWDSIMRGFPIGSFMLSDASEGRFFLLDGQQRFNAIELGYIHNQENSSVLWIDVEPDMPDNSTRKFLIKVTTKSHPWGYNNDDESSRLNTNEKREAIMAFGLSGTIYNSNFSLTQTWPVKAAKPIPFFCFSNADLNNETKFLESVKANYSTSEFTNRDAVLKGLTIENETYIKSLYKTFKRLDEYIITCNHLTKEVLEAESESADKQNEEGRTALEILFSRLNTGGTLISNEDLLYSSIKSYWPEIKDVIDRESRKYMGPAKLINLVFRLMLREDGRGFPSSPTLKKIRNIAKKEDSIAKQIIEFCNSDLPTVLKLIDEWLEVGTSETGTPSIIRTSMINRSEDVYLLLMYLAAVQIASENKFDSECVKYIKGLALSLHWFAKRPREIVNALFSSISTGGCELEVFERVISHCIYRDWLTPIFSPEKLKSHISISGYAAWRPMNNHPITNFFKFISGNREILLYSQRAYINSHFPNYDPSRRDLWEDYNRPWDFDHIIPRNWIVGKWGDYREYCKYWLNNIGNLAAISFDINRSKSDKDEYDEYISNRESLLFDDRILKINNRVANDKEQSFEFATITFNRLCSIYSNIFKEIEIIYQPRNLDAKIIDRKKLITSFIEVYPAFKVWKYLDEEYYSLESDYDWMFPWLAIGQLKADVFLAIELDGEKECWIGIRRITNGEIDKNIKNMLITEAGERFQDFEWSDDYNYYCYKCIEYGMIDLKLLAEEVSRLNQLVSSPKVR